VHKGSIQKSLEGAKIGISGGSLGKNKDDGIKGNRSIFSECRNKGKGQIKIQQPEAA